MDGSYNESGTKLACLLAQAKRSPGGLTAEVFEYLVRAVWEVIDTRTDLEAVERQLREYLHEYQGLDLTVAVSRVLLGATDVQGTCIFAGNRVTHTVHLW